MTSLCFVKKTSYPTVTLPFGLWLTSVFVWLEEDSLYDAEHPSVIPMDSTSTHKHHVNL